MPFRKELGLQEEPPEMSVEAACNIFASEPSKRITLLELMLLAYSDGDIGPREKILLDSIGAAFGIEKAQFLSAQTWAQGLNALNHNGLRFIRG